MPLYDMSTGIGDERATSTCHKDFYENMYCVVRGCKIFNLCPPFSIPLLKEVELESGEYILLRRKKKRGEEREIRKKEQDVRAGDGDDDDDDDDAEWEEVRVCRRANSLLCYEYHIFPIYIYLLLLLLPPPPPPPPLPLL